MDLKGKEQNQHLAQGRLKQCLKEAYAKLEEHGMKSAEVSSYLRPVEGLLDVVELWRNPSEGLALFLSAETGLKYYQIPIAFKRQCFIGQHYLLSPLLPLYHNDGQYYLLELSQDYVRLYQGSRFEFTDMALEDVAPQKLEDAVGTDYEQKSLQFRSGQTGKIANFHARGEGKDDTDIEILTFFRKVNEGILLKIKTHHAPLVLSCVDSLVPMYQKVNTYKNLYHRHVPGDPEFMKDYQKHRASWALVKSFFDRTRQEKLNLFEELRHSGRCSGDLSDIIPAAVNGRVDTLFIAEGAKVYGNYHQDRNTVSLDKGRAAGNTLLTEMAAMKTFLQGGKVYFLPTGGMPEQKSEMNAIFRF